LVDRRRWLAEDRFLHALSFCDLLPGPEAQQLAIYTGWLLNGAPGGIAAGVLFVLPAAFLMAGLAWLYAAGGTLPTVAAVFDGLAVWWIPLLLVTAVMGAGSIYAEQALFFSQVAVISFGGAYAVLAYVAHEVVRRFGLSGADVVAGLALAETTPGPLILVVEFY